MNDKRIYLNGIRFLQALFLLFMMQSAFAQTGTFTVNKTYDRGSNAEVIITAECTGGG